MRVIPLASTLLLAAASPGQDTLPHGTWRVSAMVSDSLTWRATGFATDAAGSVITMRSLDRGSPRSFSLTASIPADSFRGGRVRISGDLRGRDAETWFWLRVESDSGTLDLDNAFDRRVRSRDWTAQAITLDVPAAARRIAFGVGFYGNGEAGGRHVKVEKLPTPASTDPIARNVQRFLDTALAIIRLKSVLADTVTWDSARAVMLRRAAGAQTNSDAYAAIRVLLRRIGDPHGGLTGPRDGGARGGGFADDRPRNKPEMTRLAGDSVGFVRIPSYFPRESGDVDELRHMIRGFDRDGMCGWVIDLRESALAGSLVLYRGFQYLLGDGAVGSYVSSVQESLMWTAEGLRPASEVRSRAGSPPDSSAVAILIGPQTNGAGERLAIAFRGRPHTRSFGHPTGGMSQTLQAFPLPDGSTVVLTAGFSADRTGRRYRGPVPPDQVLASARADSTAADPAIETAVRWTLQQASCTGAK